MKYYTGHLSVEDSSKLTGLGIGVGMIALGAALIPMAYIGFLGIPMMVLGTALLIWSALGIREGQLELAPSAGGIALIVLGALLLAAAAWVVVVMGPGRPADAEPVGAAGVMREVFHAVVSPAIIVAGMRLRFAWSSKACAGLYGTLLVTTPLALILSLILVNLWSTTD